MSNIALCRVCLASKVKMHHVANTLYQEIFEKLSTRLCTADQRPETVCYVCFSQLQRCRRFMDMSRKAEAILTQFSLSGIQLSEDTVSILDRKFASKLVRTPLETVSINICEPSHIKVEIKQELSENQLAGSFSDLFSVQLNQEHTASSITRSELKQSHCNKNQAQCTAVDETQTLMNKTLAQMNQTHCELNEILRHQMLSVKEEIKSDDEATSQDAKHTVVLEAGKREKHTSIHTLTKSEVSEITADSECEHERKLTDQIKQEVPAEIEVSVPSTHSYEVEVLADPSGQDRVKHECPKCGKAYVQRCHLLRHIKMHDTDRTGLPSRDYVCEKCGKAFVQKCTLKKHMLSHTAEKRFRCDHCTTRCSTKIDLVRHMRMHTGQKPYKCDVCKQKFSRKNNMALHRLTHEDTKPFVCHICHMSFSRRYCLNRHNMRKHICEKPYACEICDFRSANASYVKTHMENIHLKTPGEKPYVCLMCDFRSGAFSYLKKHMVKKHSCEKKKKRAKLQC